MHMFTGLIEEIGQVRQNISSTRILSICAKTVLEDMKIGHSIAVNGVCLTVKDFDEQSFIADVAPETLGRSTLGRLLTGDKVNLERAVAANGRFGGHFVSGHIDGTGKITHKKEEGNAVWMEIEIPLELSNLIVEKGSIAVDGISLTVAAVKSLKCIISVIPHTGSQTTLVNKNVGDLVNLETDFIGKYVEKLLQANPRSSTITMDFLQQHGF